MHQLWWLVHWRRTRILSSSLSSSYLNLGHLFSLRGHDSHFISFNEYAPLRRNNTILAKISAWITPVSLTLQLYTSIIYSNVCKSSCYVLQFFLSSLESIDANIHTYIPWSFNYTLNMNERLARTILQNIWLSYYCNMILLNIWFSYYCYMKYEWKVGSNSNIMPHNWKLYRWYSFQRVTLHFCSKHPRYHLMGHDHLTLRLSEHTITASLWRQTSLPKIIKRKKVRDHFREVEF